MSSQQNFIPRVGKLTFQCKFCGKEPMQWSEIAPDTWMPFDLQKREIHHCWKKNPRNLIMRPVTDEQGRRELREIYDAISVEDGMDAYLGDGVWISSDGSWSDRGR